MIMKSLEENASWQARKIVNYLQNIETLAGIYDTVMRGQHEVMELVRLYERHREDEELLEVPAPVHVEPMFDCIADLLHMLTEFDALASQRRFFDHLQYNMEKQDADCVVLYRRKESR